VGRKPGHSAGICCQATLPDESWEAWDVRLVCDLEARTDVIPEADAELTASLQKTHKGITTVSALITACAAADLALDDVAANVSL